MMIKKILEVKKQALKHKIIKLQKHKESYRPN